MRSPRRLLRLAALSALALASTASAQATVLIDNQPTLTLNHSSCGTSINVVWTKTQQVTTCSGFKLWVTTESCGNDVDSSKGDVLLKNFSQTEFNLTGKGSVRFAVNDLPLFKKADAGACSGLEADHPMTVCGNYQPVGVTGGCADPVGISTNGIIRFDTQPPPPPDSLSASGQDSAVHLSIGTSDDDPETFAVFYAPGTTPSEGEFLAGPSVSVSGGTADVDVKSLSNDTPYTFRVYSKDAAGNTSVEPAVVVGTPVHTLGAGDLCLRRGQESGVDCPEKGGCQSAGGAGTAVLAAAVAALVFWARGRGRRRS